MQDATIPYLRAAILAAAIVMGSCAEMRVDYQTPHFMENRESVRERVSTWIGPWVDFSVSDLRDPVSFKRIDRDGAMIFPQESVYDEESDFALPLAERIELLLADRRGPSDFTPKSANVCIRRYDFITRYLDDDVVQYEVRAQYGFRGIRTEPCQGEFDFTHAAWAAGILDGASEERTKSEALSVFIDQILREYLKMTRKDQPQLQPIVLAVAPPTKTWTPPGYEDPWLFYPSQIQNYQSVHSAFGQMLRQLLVPEVNVSTIEMGAPAAQPTMPTLVVEPIYVGVLLETISFLHVRMSLRWPNGAVLLERELDGGCITTPVVQCTLQRQLETIARDMRKEVPVMLAYTERQPPAAAAAPELPAAQAPEPTE